MRAQTDIEISIDIFIDAAARMRARVFSTHQNLKRRSANENKFCVKINASQVANARNADVHNADATGGCVLGDDALRRAVEIAGELRRLDEIAARNHSLHFLARYKKVVEAVDLASARLACCVRRAESEKARKGGHRLLDARAFACARSAVQNDWSRSFHCLLELKVAKVCRC